MPVCRLTLAPAALLGALLAAGPALAQDAPVYRCGNSYQAKPCAGGAPVDVADPRSDAQRREAEANRQRDAVLARQLAAERRAAERDAARSGGPANLGPRAAPAPAKPASAAGKSPKKPKHPKALKQKPNLKPKPVPAAAKAAAVKRPWG